MDIRSPASQKSVRLLGEAGKGATIVVLRPEGGGVSKAAPLLADEFRVLNFEVAPSASPDEIAAALASHGISEAAFVASAAAAATALALALKHPQLVQSLALLAPSVLPAATATGLAELKTPVQAFFGTSDFTRPPDAARTFCKSVPNCSLMYVFDTGKSPDEERPEAVTDALKEFARKRERFMVTDKSSKLHP